MKRTAVATYMYKHDIQNSSTFNIYRTHMKKKNVLHSETPSMTKDPRESSCCLVCNTSLTFTHLETWITTTETKFYEFSTPQNKGLIKWNK